MDLSGSFIAVSKAEPGAQHDISQFRSLAPNIAIHLSSQDTILCDAGYILADTVLPKVEWHIKHKDLRNKPMTEKQINENKKWEDVRRFIEFGFGKVKSRFGVIGTVYRHKREWLKEIAPFCFALHNCIIREMTNPKKFKTEWNKTVPILPKEQRIYKKVSNGTPCYSKCYLLVYTK